MTPLPFSCVNLADSAIHNRYAAGSEQDPPQCLAATTERGSIDGQAHENVPHAVNDHEAVDDILIQWGSGRLEVEELEGVTGSDDGVDAESNEDGGEDVGGDEFIEGHVIYCRCATKLV